MTQGAAQLKMTRTFQFHGDRVLTDSVVAAGIDRVEALGGKLTLSSPVGEGISLVIELPLEPS